MENLQEFKEEQKEADDMMKVTPHIIKNNYKFIGFNGT